MRQEDNSISANLPNGENGGTYEFKVKGRLDDRWLDWFDGITLRYTTDDQTGREVTAILASIADQPALHGLLNKIRDLNLTLLSFRKLTSPAGSPPGGDENAS